MDLIYKFLDELNIEKNENIIVGVSYGPDSMLLLYILRKYFENNNIVCAHVHHNHRKESDEEAYLLKKYCEDNNIIFEMFKIDKYTNNKFTEEEARIKRYNFFDSLIKKYNSKYLFTAHHGDDLIETILMRIVRGSTLNGYSGIKIQSKRNNYNLIRPLLYITKNDILTYCKEYNIPYAVDKSNSDNSYTRNRYRNNVLPILKDENEDVHKQFLKFSTVLQEYNTYVEKIVNEKYKYIVIKNELNISLLIKEDEFIIKQIIMKFLSNIYEKNIYLINSDHLNLIIKLIKNNKTNDKMNLPNNKVLIKSYNKIYFDNNNMYNDYCLELNDKVKLPNGYILEIVDELENTTNYFTAFNKKDILFPIKVRNRKNGDKISVLGLDGSKKIKDILINEKININERRNYPVLVDKNNDILWLPGIKKSKYDRSKKGNYDIIIKYYKEEENEK